MIISTAICAYKLLQCLSSLESVRCFCGAKETLQIPNHYRTHRLSVALSLVATVFLLSGTLCSPGEAQSVNNEGSFSTLTLASDGSLLGTTATGGGTGNGSVFKATVSGQATSLYSFNSFQGFDDNIDGAQPKCGVIMAADGSLYGTASTGGIFGTGTVFKLGMDGVFTVLYSFTAVDMNGGNVDGVEPSGVILADNGTLLGSTASGGANGTGTVYKVAPDGTFQLLYAFSANDSQSNADGANPQAHLVRANDGKYYGTASNSGPSNDGTIFTISTSGSFAVLHTFSNVDGSNPCSEITQGSDGNFYGKTPNGGGYDATGGGGTTGNGVVYKINVGLTQLVPK